MTGSEPPPANPAGPSPQGPPGRRALTLAGEASLRRRLVARDEQALVELIELASPWLLRIARNRAIDRLRRRRRWRLKLARAEAFGELPADRVRAKEVDEAAQPGWHVHESVHAALERLPADQREVVRLAYFQGLTHSEIAGRLGIPMGTVKTRLRLAFDKLRVSLAPIKDWIA